MVLAAVFRTVLFLAASLRFATVVCFLLLAVSFFVAFSAARRAARTVLTAALLAASAGCLRESIAEASASVAACTTPASLALLAISPHAAAGESPHAAAGEATPTFGQGCGSRRAKGCLGRPSSRGASRLASRALASRRRGHWARQPGLHFRVIPAARWRTRHYVRRWQAGRRNTPGILSSLSAIVSPASPARSSAPHHPYR